MTEQRGQRGHTFSAGVQGSSHRPEGRPGIPSSRNAQPGGVIVEPFTTRGNFVLAPSHAVLIPKMPSPGGGCSVIMVQRHSPIGPQCKMANPGGKGNVNKSFSTFLTKLFGQMQSFISAFALRTSARGCARHASHHAGGVHPGDVCQPRPHHRGGHPGLCPPRGAQIGNGGVDVPAGQHRRDGSVTHFCLHTCLLPALPSPLGLMRRGANLGRVWAEFCLGGDWG